MNRRVFLSVLSGSLLAAPLAAAAQQAGKVARIGFLVTVPSDQEDAPCASSPHSPS